MLRERLQMVTNSIYFDAPVATNAPWVTVREGAGGGWRVVYVYHLAPAENGMKHVVYVDLIDERGVVVTKSALRLGHTWEGRRDDDPAPSVALEKPPSEPLGNLPIQRGQKLSIWLEDATGARISDAVQGLHAVLPSNGEGNDWHHHSYYVVFQKRSSAGSLAGDGIDTANGADKADGKLVATRSGREIIAKIRDHLRELEQLL